MLGWTPDAANTLNIATCTIGGFDSAKLNAYLNLDTKKELSTLMIALGYSDDEEIPANSCFEFDEVVRFLHLEIPCFNSLFAKNLLNLKIKL